MRCIAREPNSGRRSAGFTLIEVLVVAPMVILMLGTIIAMLVNLSSSAMRASAQASLQNDVLAALDMIEQDVKLSTAIAPGVNSLMLQGMEEWGGRRCSTPAWIRLLAT